MPGVGTDAVSGCASAAGWSGGAARPWDGRSGVATGTALGVDPGAWAGSALGARASTPLGVWTGAGRPLARAIRVGVLGCLTRSCEVGVGVIHLKEKGALGAEVTRRREMQALQVSATASSNKIETKHLSGHAVVFMILPSCR